MAENAESISVGAAAISPFSAGILPQRTQSIYSQLYIRIRLDVKYRLSYLLGTDRNSVYWFCSPFALLLFPFWVTLT